ncbi:MAG: FtsQ-type POTRA domain-containing protein [Actinomycetota bacterium]|nr:FtsQ-type POTRA domain-containing protein [Actinomycetota bacterium]
MSPVWRRRLLALAVLTLVLVLGYTLWLRDSSLFAVDEVKVEGATTNQEQITAALEQTLDGMTTLHIRDDELRDAVAGFPTVASIRADASLMHSVTITITERLPVATVDAGGEQLVVSAEGYVLTGISAEGALPPIEAAVEGARLDPDGASQAAIVGAAPAELRERINSGSWDPERGGVVIDLEGAPELRFGDADRAETKWRALVTVLSDEKLGAPAYVDVSVPERPVAAGTP